MQPRTHRLLFHQGGPGRVGITGAILHFCANSPPAQTAYCRSDCNRNMWTYVPGYTTFNYFYRWSHRPRTIQMKSCASSRLTLPFSVMYPSKFALPVLVLIALPPFLPKMCGLSTSKVHHADHTSKFFFACLSTLPLLLITSPQLFWLLPKYIEHCKHAFTPVNKQLLLHKSTNVSSPT